MKKLHPLLSLLFFVVTATLHAFTWPGGTITVSVTCYGDEVFAGYVPSSPWGSSNWLFDPVLELRNSSGDVIAERVVGGGANDWYSGGSRSASVSFSAP